MLENPRRGRQARNFTTNVPKILDLKSSSEQIFSENCRWVTLSEAIDRTLAWTPRYRWKHHGLRLKLVTLGLGNSLLLPFSFSSIVHFTTHVQTSHKITRESRHTQWEFSHLLPNWRLPWPVKRATCTDFVSKSRTPLCFLQQFFENYNSLISVARQVWFMIACSKRSDSGERCKVKKAIKSRGGLGFIFFALLFTSHRSPLSERLEQARFMSGDAFMPHKSVCIALFPFAKYKHIKLIKILS